MADTDPTMDLMNALNRADPSEWGLIKYGTPIFREHSVYEVEDGQGNKNLVVVPKGDQPPKNGKCIHTVDKARLEQITAEINRNYAEGGKPVKLFIGHSDPKTPQHQNPQIVGFGRKAYMGTFGPQNIAAIKTDAFFKQGHESAATEYPERSAEFNPRTNAITGVALLKTDPRLPMGMLAFAAEHDTIYYGVGFMAEDIINNAFPDKTEKPAEKPAPAAEKPAPEAPKSGEKEVAAPAPEPAKNPEPSPEAEKPEDAVEETPEMSPAAPKPFAPHEVQFADRLMAHLEQNHPAMKYMCGEHKKYMESQAAMAQPKPTAASATNGFPPTNGEPKKKPDESMNMSETERLDYAEMTKRVLALETENAILYATEALDSLEKQGKVIKDKPKEIKKLVAMKTLEERQAHLADIKLNYADAERSPARGRSWLPIDDGHVEGAVANEAVAEPEAAEIVRYGEENNIDITTDAGLRKCIAALTKKDKAA